MGFLKLLFFLICFVVEAQAADEKLEFKPTQWTRGIHFLPGIGLNTSVFDSRVQNADTGWGASIRMDVGYYFTNDFALEASS